MDVATRTLSDHGGGRLVVSGYQGEAERLAAMATHQDVVIEATATSTWENVERSIPFMETAQSLAVATDWFHGRVTERYLKEMRPDLADRLIRPSRKWWRGLLIQVGGAGYAALRSARRTGRRHRNPERGTPKRSE